MMRSLMAVALLFVVACGGEKKEGEPKKGGSEAPKPATKSPPAQAGPDFAAWDVEGKQKAWQGSWVLKDNGTFQAWTVAGDKVQTWDGTEEKTYTLKVEAPCRALFKTDGGVMYPHEFAAVGGKLRSRPGGAGYKKGAEAIFCDPSGAIYTLDAAGKCTLWASKFGDFEKTDGECGWKKNDKGEEVFFHKGANEGEFAVEGDAILSTVSAETEPAADHAAAKAARDAKAAAK